MDVNGVFKSKLFAKRKKERENSLVTEKTDHIYESDIYVAGKYHPILYIDGTMRVSGIATNQYLLIEQYDSDVMAQGDAILKITKVDVKQSSTKDFSSEEYYAQPSDHLISITNVDIQKGYVFDFSLNHLIGYGNEIITISNVQMKMNGCVDLTSIPIGYNIKETMVRVNDIRTTNFTISSS